MYFGAVPGIATEKHVDWKRTRGECNPAYNAKIYEYEVRSSLLNACSQSNNRNYLTILCFLYLCSYVEEFAFGPIAKLQNAGTYTERTHEDERDV